MSSFLFYREDLITGAFVTEREDERKQLILIKSKSRTFDIMNIVMFITFFALTLLGQLSFYSFLIFGIFVLCVYK